MATVCSLFPRQNTIWFYYPYRLRLFLSPLSSPPNQDRPSMFKTHYMRPPGIYSGTLPVTPFCAGVPREHGEMSSSKAWKRWGEWDGGDWATPSARETEWNLSEINTYGYFMLNQLSCGRSSSVDWWRGERRWKNHWRYIPQSALIYTEYKA